MTAAIVRFHKPSPAQLDQCIAAHQPVIFTGLMDDQPAIRHWNVDYLRAHLGGRPIQVVNHDRPRLHWDPAAGLPLQTMSIDQFADRAFGRKDAGFSYLQDDVNSFPGIKQDYRLPAMMEARDIKRSKFWLSGAGLITPLHYDAVETFHWVVRGSKRFVCYRPGVRAYYPYPARSSAPFISRVDPDDPQPEIFPRFKAAQPLEFSLEEGEILYLPTYWWHQVYSEGGVNISINFVWLTSRLRSLRHLPQYLRARRHIARQAARAREKSALAALQTEAQH
jgi:hypothetical protein